MTNRVNVTGEYRKTEPMNIPRYIRQVNYHRTNMMLVATFLRTNEWNVANGCHRASEIQLINMHEGRDCLIELHAFNEIH